MDDRQARRRRGLIALCVSAAAITVLGLAGPIMLATTGDASPVMPIYVPGWLIAIAGFLYWLRTR